MKRKIMASLLAVCLCITLFPSPALAETTESTTTPVTSGSINGSDNASWSYDSQTKTLTVSGTGEIPAFEAESTAAWKPFADEIETIVIEKGITAVNSNAFTDMKNLKSVTINRTVTEISGTAFDAGTTATFYGKRNSEAMNYAKNNNLNFEEIVSANILFIGNSYTEDAREYIRYVFDQYNFDADVNIGHLFSGGKTVAYYANCAREEAGYSTEFGVATKDTESPRAENETGDNQLNYYKSVGEAVSFTSQGVRTITYAMGDMDWDIVIIQGHDVEQVYGDTYNKNFASNLNYLTNFIKSLDSSVEIGYYMTWRRNAETVEGRLSKYWETMQKTVAANNNISFIVPVGTAAENARTTFLNNLSYTPASNANVGKVNLLTGAAISGSMTYDNNDGLQRDNTHMSAVLGRFLAGYTMGEFLVDHINSMGAAQFEKKTNGAIKEIYSFDPAIGRLPALYVDIVKASAEAAFEKPYEVTTLNYSTDPAENAKTALKTAKYEYANLSGTSLAAAIKATAEEELNNLCGKQGYEAYGFKTPVVTVSDGYIAPTGNGTSDFTATIQIQFGYTFKTVEIEGRTYAQRDSSAGDINSDGFVDIKDAVLLAQHLAEWDVTVNEAAADCNGDGAVDIKDAVLLAQYLAEWDVELKGGKPNTGDNETSYNKDFEIDIDTLENN